VSINLEGGNRSSEKWKREEIVMANEWLTDARKIPDEVMSYIRKLAVRAVVEFGWSPECVYAVFGLSRSSLYDWLDKWCRGGYEALETRVAPGAKLLITPEMDDRLKGTVLSSDPTDYGYGTPLWTCEILAALLARGFGVRVIAATVNAHLKKLGLSLSGHALPCSRAGSGGNRTVFER
jgi:transposase